MSLWFRFYSGVVDDPKAQMLAPEMFKHWVNVLCIAAQNDGELPAISATAFTLRISEPKAAGILAKLHAAGLLDKTERSFKPHNWDGRQYKTKEPKEGEVDGEHKGKYVYLIGSAVPGSPIKIGISKNPWARVGELQTSHPDKLFLKATFKTTGPSEADLHLLLDKHRRQGEWFDLPPQVLEVVESAYVAKSNYASLLVLLRSSYVVAPRAETEQNTEDRIVSASAFTEGSKALASSFWKALGFRTPLEIPPEYAGTDWRAVSWEKSGWTPDLIETEVRRVGPAKPLSYYEKVFATAFARRQAPLPIVKIREAETIKVTAHGKPKSAIIQAADDLCRTIAGFDGPKRGSDELRSIAGEAPPRLLSNG